MADQRTPRTDGPARKRSIWPYALGVMFCIHASIVFITMTFASRTPANAEPDYYEKAVAWDEQAEDRLTAGREGWSRAVTIEGKTVTLALSDREGRGISGADIKAIAFHRIDALDRTEIVFEESIEGVYVGKLPARRVGLWDLRWTIQAVGAPRATFIETVEVH